MARFGARGSDTPGSGPRTRAATIPVPDVYQEMLADAVSSSPTMFGEEGTALKKRRVGGRIVVHREITPSKLDSDFALDTAGDSANFLEAVDTTKLKQQTVYDESDDSTDSDLNWEEVNLEAGAKDEGSADEKKELDLVLGRDNSRSADKARSQRRKPITTSVRKLRLEVHKMHLISLLVHVHLRNHWCNDHKVQARLRKLLSEKTLAYLDDDEKQSQFQRSRSLMDGLEQASKAFSRQYKITARGLNRPYWAEEPERLAESKIPTDVDLPMQKTDFQAVAAKLEASRDVGAQLFCALLRSAGVEARLICSLQVLPFTSTAKSTIPMKLKPAYTVAYADTRHAISDDDSAADAGSDTSIRTAGSSSMNDVSRIRSRLATRLGRPLQTAPNTSGSPMATSIKQPKQKPIRESPYPIYWVEAFNSAVQKWIPVDPLVTETIAKPSKFEPPASDTENNMIYVIAFEDDGSARDVTRRYAKNYNAKTIKSRVEITKGGPKWLRMVLQMYKKSYPDDRDQLEDAELTSKEAAEGMPKNLQDFKDHPYYALERHLKRSEVIHPKREVGKVTVSKSSTASSSKALETVYRRRDVHGVKSADGWYRLGREIKTGEQPLKRAQPQRRLEVVPEDNISEDDENAGTAMYAAFQTVPYQAPPVVRGRVPKNHYGNIDVYVPSMVPPGGVYIVHPDTARAARLLGVDYSDAVIGFEFKGRHGTAVIKGAVVALEYQEAVQEVITGFEYEKSQAEKERRSLEVLRMWKRFLTGLRIRERISGYEVEGEESATRDDMEHLDRNTDKEENDGFVPDRDDSTEAGPTTIHPAASVEEYNHEDGGGFVADDPERNMYDVVYPKAISLAIPERASNYVDAELNGGGFLAEAENGDEGEEKDIGETAHDIELNCLEKAPQILEQTTTRINKHLKHEDGLDVEDFGSSYRIHHDLTVEELAEAEIVQQIFKAEPQHLTGRAEEDSKAKNNSLSTPVSADYPTAIGEAEFQQDNSMSKSQDEAEYSFGRGTQPSENREIHDTGASTEDSEIDKGSLLSHDPSDEEADPEWLA